MSTPRMAGPRPRLLTLTFGGMETIIRMPKGFTGLMAAARDWIKPPQKFKLTLRIPVEYAPAHAIRHVAGPYIYLTGEDSFEIAVKGVWDTRVEICGYIPPIQHTRREYPTRFTGTQLLPGVEPYRESDTAVLTCPATAIKLLTAKCNLSIISPAIRECHLELNFSPHFRMGIARPPPSQYFNKRDRSSTAKYSLLVHPKGILVGAIPTSLYYETIPNKLLAHHNFVTPRNGFAMSFPDFISSVQNALCQLGMSKYDCTLFIKNNMPAFSAHRNIAYKILSQRNIAAAVDIAVSIKPYTLTRIFLIFRGLTDDEILMFTDAKAGAKEATRYNWREIVGLEFTKDPVALRILETSVLEVT